MQFIKVSSENRGKIQALITAAEVSANTGMRDVEDVFSACQKAEKEMNYEVGYSARAGAILNIYPAKERTGTCVSLIRRKTGWFLSRIWRQAGTVPESGTRLIMPPNVRDYGRRI